jgi:glutaredoxin
MITIYSKDTCPKCVQAKDLLTRKGVRYVEINIEADEEAKLFLVSRGFRSVPQINVDGEFLDGGLGSLVEQSDEFFNHHKSA